MEDGDRLSAMLRLWASEQAVGEAAAARRRQRWLTTQAEETATLLGSLVDLAEGKVTVAVHTAADSYGGVIRGVGRDFFVLDRPGSPPVAVAVGAIRSVTEAGPPRPARAAGAGVGDREPPLDLRLVDMLGVLAADRQSARLQLDGGHVVTGSLRSVGVDVVVVVPDDAARRPVVVPLASVHAVSPV
jgi:hypothetical protein